mgnify:CR=1 FL=1
MNLFVHRLSLFWWKYWIRSRYFWRISISSLQNLDLEQSLWWTIVRIGICHGVKVLWPSCLCHLYLDDEIVKVVSNVICVDLYRLPVEWKSSDARSINDLHFIWRFNRTELVIIGDWIVEWCVKAAVSKSVAGDEIAILEGWVKWRENVLRISVSSSNIHGD